MTVTQRLFGKTTVDSLEVTRGSWSIDDEKVYATAEQLNKTIFLTDWGKQGVGGAVFTFPANCTSVNLGSVVYKLVLADPVVANGEWVNGGSATASAINFAAAINGDTRNGGYPYYSAYASNTAVHIFQIIPKTEDIAVTRVDGTQPTIVTDITGGRDPQMAKITVFWYTMRVSDAYGASFAIPVTFAPTAFTVQVRTAEGLLKVPSDTFSIESNPNRIQVNFAGENHILPTDTITVMSEA